ncbi:MAG: transporter substrate-binding domain-containing protein [Clostridia bacterium]|nr:transporter substrate-binding domain-containing protein [Oscillospiraceae bacterium]MBQ2773969.1 transporter substrate-binding domain-containing protein [Clostridia bacterium]MBQ3055935.1 transporter substrate-binding domain-containing protein [Clostridia bacterium]MBR2465279.1 transporter substrate-binding domain-containing protein [Clostridia bacterium]MBR3862489.1 transporter substrate-binding domain-containing protein [Clostridia bacterium]
MKKIVALTLAVLMLLTTVVAFASCGKKNDDFVATDAVDLLKEDFGIGVKKNCPDLLAAVNAVVDEWVTNGKMAKYEEYYTKLADYAENGGTAPEAGDLQVSWDFGSATEVITVYTESGFAPFEFIYNEAVTGLDMAIMSQVAVNMGKKIEIKDVLFDSIPTSVQSDSGLAVAAAGLTINEERADMMDFSNVYYSSTLVIVSDKEAPITSVKDLAGKKVGVQQGTSGDLIITAAAGAEGYSYVTEDAQGAEVTVVVKAANAEVKQYEKYAMALADLKAGRIDAILMDKLPAQTMLAGTN